MFEVVGFVVWDCAGGVGVAGAGDEDCDVDYEIDQRLCGGGEPGDVCVRRPQVGRGMFFEARVFACVCRFEGWILVE